MERRIQDQGMVPVDEAARELGVSPQRIRALVKQGRLDAYRAGPVMLVARESLAERAGYASHSGRPWSPVMAWAALCLIDGDRRGLSLLDSRGRWRLRRRLEASQSLEGLAARLVHRATVYRLRGHSSLPVRLRQDGVRSGISAADDYGLDLLDDAGLADVYVRAGAVVDLKRRYRLRPPSQESANVILRAVPEEAWVLAGWEAAPRAAVALDLLEYPDSRSHSAGAELAAALWPPALP